MNKKIKMLAVDSEEIILKSISRALKSDKSTEFIITTSTTSLDALKQIRENTFDLIILDLALPGMNGIEIFRRIKNIYPEIPIIIMSGFSFSGIHYNLGMDEIAVNETFSKAAGFLLKPFTTDEINTLVKNIVSKDI